MRRRDVVHARFSTAKAAELIEARIGPELDAGQLTTMAAIADRFPWPHTRTLLAVCRLIVDGRFHLYQAGTRTFGSQGLITGRKPPRVGHRMR